MTTKLMTVEELEQMPDDGYRYDLVRGELVRMSPAGRRHGRVAFTLGFLLAPHVNEQALGELYAAETGFILARDPDLVRAPDVSFVRADRLTGEMSDDGYLNLAPDLAVEVVSPTDRYRQVLEKVMDYLNAGTPLVWVIEPRRRLVTVYTPDQSARILTEQDELDGGDVLPGFRTPVAAIFR